MGPGPIIVKVFFRMSYCWELMAVAPLSLTKDATSKQMFSSAGLNIFLMFLEPYVVLQMDLPGLGAP